MLLFYRQSARASTEDKHLYIVWFFPEKISPLRACAALIFCYTHIKPTVQRRQAQAADEPRRTPENNLPSSPFPHSLLPKAREPPEQLFGGFGFFVLLSDICAEDGGHLGVGRTAVRREVAAVAADHKAARIRPLHRSLRPGRDLTGVAVAGKVCARRHIRAGQAARAARARQPGTQICAARRFLRKYPPTGLARRSFFVILVSNTR